MWLKIRLSDHAVVGTNYASKKPTLADNEVGAFEYKEWLGAEPPLHDSEQGIESYDPTLSDPDYSGFLETRVDFNTLAEQANIEIDWLTETIPNIGTMTATQIRDVVRRLAQENLQMIKAWRYVLKRLG